MTQELLRHELPDVAGPDDHRVLEVVDPATANRAGDRTEDDDVYDGGRPEDEHLRRRRVPELRQIRERPEEPCGDGDHVEHTRELIGPRVIRPFLVSLVQPVDLRGDDPERHRKGKDAKLHVQVRVRLKTRGGGLREEHRRDQTEQVCRQEHPPDQPPAALHH